MTNEIDTTLYESERGFGVRPAGPDVRGILLQRFIVPPFSVLDARAGYWQDRKSRWRALGLEGELGRGGNLLGHPETTGNIDFYSQKRRLEQEDNREYTTAEARERLIKLGRVVRANRKNDLANDDESVAGTSMFDPVLSELATRWFCPPGGQIVDPFAGGCVRGIVAQALGRKYWGADLRPEQIEANRKLADKILPGNRPTWVLGDAADQLRNAPPADLIFTCPPYGDLEQYSDDPRDLSNMDAAGFRKAYAAIIRLSCERLKPDRFACFVVGDYRDKAGLYAAFPARTVHAFERAGLRLYNEAVYIQAVASLSMRVRRPFESSRKLGKSHQNVLVFVKGDPRAAAAACGGTDV